MRQRTVAAIVCRPVDRRRRHVAALAGLTRDDLRGKRIGMMCEAIDAPDAILFRDAAVGLGAHVVHLRTSLSALSTQQEVQDTARLLGRLDDAVDCQRMEPGIVRQMGVDAGVPVYVRSAHVLRPFATLSVRWQTVRSSLPAHTPGPVHAGVGCPNHETI